MVYIRSAPVTRLSRRSLSTCHSDSDRRAAPVTSLLHRSLFSCGRYFCWFLWKATAKLGIFFLIFQKDNIETGILFRKTTLDLACTSYKHNCNYLWIMILLYIFLSNSVLLANYNKLKKRKLKTFHTWVRYFAQNSDRCAAGPARSLGVKRRCTPVTLRVTGAHAPVTTDLKKTMG